ncbi:hypothetical protein JAAARDRAFT_59903 [Jaapia argillacea MUCL 33604]|uniref:Uncharacterized protein n=1 Tax=Jaapia argillacea MUCL 33604 TaxID=933084 RepID=A0A067PYH6_9AGAM|nr:hypothetical protein JAAARDRAFT_59903 [Jaapia argillacea MUCL 33604]
MSENILQDSSGSSPASVGGSPQQDRNDMAGPIGDTSHSVPPPIKHPERSLSLISDAPSEATAVDGDSQAAVEWTGDTTPDTPTISHKLLWMITNICFLGLASKSLRRLKNCFMVTESWRGRQQEEWARQAIMITFMATVSAASLSFSGIDQSWWLCRAAFTAALGLDLCAFVAIYYFGLLVEGLRDQELAWALSTGGELSGQKMVAVTLAVPLVLFAYSTLLIFLGLCIYVLTMTGNQRAGGFASTLGIMSEPWFQIVAGAPIGIGIITVLGAVGVAELMYRKVVKTYDEKKEDDDKQKELNPNDVMV